MDDNKSKYKVLIVDDDVAVHQALGGQFGLEGYTVISSYNGSDGVYCVKHERPDIVILDVMMPVMDGLMACRAIRGFSTVPIIFLSAKGEEFDRLLGMEVGADDYLVKPYSVREVIAHAKVFLRRTHETKDEGNGTHVVAGNLEIDIAAFTVKLNGEPIQCTPKEIEIMWILVNNPGMVFSREHLLQRIWGFDYMGDMRAVDSHMKRIRSKLCKLHNGWDIKTVWGVGYRFEIE